MAESKRKYYLMIPVNVKCTMVNYEDMVTDNHLLLCPTFSYLIIEIVNFAFFLCTNYINTLGAKIASSSKL